MIRPDATVVGSIPGDFYGRPTLRLANGAIEVEVLAAAGPRIVRLGPAGDIMTVREILGQPPGPATTTGGSHA